MNIVCVICSDRLTPSDDVFYTPCGHIFHFACLTQWLERSKTCPQCREKVTQSRIHRIYFNFCNNDSQLEDPSALQAMVDSLKFQVMVKEREVKQALTKNDSHKKESAGLRAEVRKLENEMTHKETAILALKEQTRFFKGLSTEAENAKKEVARLKNKLDEFKCIQTLINGPMEDVDDVMANTRDPDRLLTYISVMKKELTASVARRRDLRSSMRKLQQDLTAVSMERNFLLDEREKRKELEDLLAVAECEKHLLECRVKELESGIPNVKTDNKTGHDSKNSVQKSAISLNKNSAVIDLSEDSPGPRNPRLARMEKPVLESSLSTLEDEKSNDENSPLFPTVNAPYNVHAEVARRKKNLLSASSAYPLLAKKRRLARTVNSDRAPSDMAYDGYGGHSKVDRFPVPKVMNKDPKRSLRRASSKRLDDGKNLKLGDFVNLDP